ENIYRHMKQGESPWTAALNGRAEIGAAAVAITLVDVVVYTPVAFLTGMVGQFFREFGGTIVVATLFSLLVSFTLTPMLASRWLTANAEERSPLAPVWRRWEAGYDRLTIRYRSLLANSLRHRWLVLLTGLVAFLAGIALVAFNLVGTEFMTQSDQGEFSVVAEMPPGTSLAGTNQALRQLEEGLAKIPEVESLLTTVGVGGQYGLPQHRSAMVYVRLKPAEQRSRTVLELSEDVRALGNAIPGMRVRLNYPSVVGYMGQPVLIRIRGTDMEVLSQVAGQVEEIMRRTPGLIDVTNSAAEGAPEMRLEIDHQRLSDLGLTTAQVASALRTAFEGTVATEFRRENEDKVDVRVLYASTGDRTELAAVPSIPLATPSGTEVKLNQVARLVPVKGPSEIARENRMRQIMLGANLEGRPLGEVTAELRQATNALSLPAGYSIVMSGDTELQEEAFSSILKALVISILLIYMLMVALYESLVYPLVIMGSLPVASVGAIGALWVTGNTLNMFSLVGLIMLTGLVAKNAILLVDYTNTLRRRGYTRTDALLEAGPVRLRPIIMTTAAMVFAMIPLALKIGEGAETRNPMAVVVIGGLLTSTLLTLVVVPAGYTVMDDLQRKLGARFRQRARQEAPLSAPKGDREDRRGAGTIPPVLSREE
ncbi:MAG: efflux RND transporter permease subunit, partial [Sphingomonadaceae bacterium]